MSLHQQDIKELKNAPTDISAIGIRYLSSYLKSKRHSVKIIFLPKPYGQREKKNELRQINKLITDICPDLIGVSLMSNNFYRAIELTKMIKKIFNIPVIWGGIHPTIKPVECLEYADMVCVGEGELALEKLLTNKTHLTGGQSLDVEGIWYKKEDQIVETGVAPLIFNIDEIPYPDYDFSDHYIIHKGILQKLEIDIFRKYYPASSNDHRLISTRGCPHACAYCCNSVFRSMYGIKYLRKRSVKNVINEMVEVKKRFSFIKSFKLMDDSFTTNSNEWLREFSQQYKEKINLPFFCLISPLTVNKEKLSYLIDCGLHTVQIGLQSGSDRINKDIYLRHATSKIFLETVNLLETHKDKIELIIDVITDNPYETDKDLIETVSVLNKIKRPFRLALFSLAFYPGTALYNKVTEDKIPINEKEYLFKEFHLFRKTYLNKLIFLVPFLPEERVNRFIEERDRFLMKFWLGSIFFLYLNKNKFPGFISTIFSKVKNFFKL